MGREGKAPFPFALFSLPYSLPFFAPATQANVKRNGDHFGVDLGIISGLGTISGSGSFRGLYSVHLRYFGVILWE